MGRNIDQILTAATSIGATDRLYLGISPFGLTDDRYILGSSIISQFQAHSATLDAVTAGTYTGSNSITTVGTVTTGTWSAILGSNVVTTASVTNANITYAKIQNVATASLLGNPTGAPATVSEITLGAGLNFSGTTLVSTGSGGTVTTVSVTTGNGVSAVVTNPTTTPALAFTLGAITPASVNSIVFSGSSTPTLAVTGTTTVSGANTGDQFTSSGANTFLANATAGTATPTAVALSASQLAGRGASGNIAAIGIDTSLAFSGTTLQRAALTGDATASAGSNALTLATVNSNVGSFTNASVTVNGKGLVTAVSSSTNVYVQKIATNVTSAPTSGTSPTTLQTVTVPGNTLSTDGNFLRYTAALLITGTGVGTSSISLIVNSVTVGTITPSRVASGVIYIDMSIVRLNSTSIQATGFFSTASTVTGVVGTTTAIVNTPAFVAANSFTISISATAGTNDVVTQSTTTLTGITG